MHPESSTVCARPGVIARLLRLRLALEGLPFLLPLLLALLLTLFLLHGPWRWLALLPGLLSFAVAGFFRDPHRVPPADESLIVAPADGKVLQIETNAQGQRIAIFLSVFDVHINRAPYGGTAGVVEYRPGLFLAAWDKRCTAENEQTRIELNTTQGQLKLAQIAGLIARRIITKVVSGQTVTRGARIGLIRFGSRTELTLPPNATVLCKIGDYVWGGETPLAQWNQPS